jgi:hypothetical protein
VFDGADLGSDGSYDDGTNEITFLEPLPIPPVVEVTYMVTAECET